MKPFDLAARSRWTRRIDRLGYVPGTLFLLGLALVFVGDPIYRSDEVLGTNIGLMGWLAFFLAIALALLWGAVELGFRVIRALAVSMGWIAPEAGPPVVGLPASDVSPATRTATAAGCRGQGGIRRGRPGR